MFRHDSLPPDGGRRPTMDASASAEPTDLTVEVAPGVELAVTRRGHGPTVLLVGGLGMPQLIWEMCGLTASLVEAGFEVVTYNARGLAPSRSEERRVGK